MSFVLVTGGARSGKSRFAETRVAELAPPPWTYFATVEAGDDEMRVRIDRHRARRGPEWRTVEAPRQLAAAVAREKFSGALVDCVTLWLSNRLFDGASDEELLADADALANTFAAAPEPLVVVTNEVGDGIVPDNPLARRFRDLAGLTNQRLARAASEVVLVVSGLPLRLR